MMSSFCIRRSGNCFCSNVCKSPTASCTESEDRFTKFHTNLFSKLPGAALNTRIYCELQKAVSQFFNVPTCQFVACRLFLTIDKNPHFSGEMLWRHLYCRVLVCPQLSHLSHIQWTLFYVYFVLTDLTRMVKFFHRKRSCTGWVCLSVCLSYEVFSKWRLNHWLQVIKARRPVFSKLSLAEVHFVNIGSYIKT